MSKYPAQSDRGTWYRIVEGILRPPLLALSARDWRGGEQLRIPGGVVLAMNHLSWYDPLVAALFANDNGRPVRFLAKAEVFLYIKALERTGCSIPVVHVLWEHVDWVRFPAARPVFNVVFKEFF